MFNHRCGGGGGGWLLTSFFCLLLFNRTCFPLLPHKDGPHEDGRGEEGLFLRKPSRSGSSAARALGSLQTGKKIPLSISIVEVDGSHLARTAFLILFGSGGEKNGIFGGTSCINLRSCMKGKGLTERLRDGSSQVYRCL